MKIADFLTAESIRIFGENFPIFKERGLGSVIWTWR
jgi:hypothetical protein